MRWRSTKKNHSTLFWISVFLATFASHLWERITMKEFIIPFYGLKTGIHEYTFDIGQAFFEAFESNLIENGQFKVKLKLEKTINLLNLDFSAKGVVSDYCDRCGEPIELKVKTSDHLIVKFGEDAYEQTDEVLVISHDTHELDVSQRIYEMLVLGMPSKRVHKKLSDCNQEVLERLQNAEEEDKTDPRWDALKNLK
jgi:uncharacterized metal-binding protein YceD (DUF177 family)